MDNIFSKSMSRAAKKYNNIYFVGHSLGCLIGIDADCSDDVKFSGMLLLACPLRIRLSMRYIRTCYRAIRDKNPSSVYVKAAKDANSVFFRSPFELITCPKPYIGLLLMILQSRHKFKHMTENVCMIHSEKDEIVSKKSINYIRFMPNGRVVILPESGHFYYAPSAQKIILQELTELLNKSQQIVP